MTVPNFQATIAVLRGDEILCSDHFSTSSTTVAVHVLTNVPLHDAAAKQVIAKELGLWVGANDYYASPSRRYLLLDGWITSANSNWAYNHNRALEKAWLLLLASIAAATNRTLILPPLFTKNVGAYAWEYADMATLPVDWRPTSFLLHPETRAVNSAHLFPLAVLSVRPGGRLAYANWDNARRLERSLSTHWRKFSRGGRRSGNPGMSSKQRHNGAWWLVVGDFWGALLREAELKDATTLVLRLDAGLEFPEAHYAAASHSSGVRDAEHSSSPAAALLRRVAEIVHWCPFPDTTMSDDGPADMKVSRVCVEPTSS
jgi:hypothetical protein